MHLANTGQSDLAHLDRVAFKLIEDATRAADDDALLFNTPKLRGQLIELANAVITSPETGRPKRSDAHNLYAIFDQIVIRTLWKESEFAEITVRLLKNTNPGDKEIFIDCLCNSDLNHSGYASKLLEQNPNLLTQILDAAISTNSETALAQTINIFSNLGRDRIVQADTEKLLSAIEKNPGSQILAEAAILFANNPNKRFSDILHKNFRNIDNLDLKDQSVLRYLLNHPPSAEVVKKTIQTGLNIRAIHDNYPKHDNYPGNAGLLEAGLYLKRHRQDIGLSIMGLGNLFDMIANRSLSPRNFSEEAAIRFMARNLKSFQPEHAIIIAFKALGSSHNPAALDYLDKVSNIPGFFQKCLTTITLSCSNICSSYLRLTSALGGLKNNTSAKAQVLRDRLSLRLDQRIPIDFVK